MQEQEQAKRTRILELGTRIDSDPDVEVAYFNSATVLFHEDGRVAAVEKTGRHTTYNVYLYECRYNYVHRNHKELERTDWYINALTTAAEWVGIDTEETNA
jgi:hypothetical protein